MGRIQDVSTICPDWVSDVEVAPKTHDRAGERRIADYGGSNGNGATVYALGRYTGVDVSSGVSDAFGRRLCGDLAGSWVVG